MLRMPQQGKKKIKDTSNASAYTRTKPKAYRQKKRTEQRQKKHNQTEMDRRNRKRQKRQKKDRMVAQEEPKVFLCVVCSFLSCLSCSVWSDSVCVCLGMFLSFQSPVVCPFIIRTVSSGMVCFLFSGGEMPAAFVPSESSHISSLFLRGNLVMQRGVEVGRALQPQDDLAELVVST